MPENSDGRNAPVVGELLSDDEIAALEPDLAAAATLPLGARRIYSFATRADRELTDFSSEQTAATKKSPWPMLERKYDEAVKLPPPTPLANGLSEILTMRRSKQDAAAEPVGLGALSNVLHWSYGLREMVPAYSWRQYPMRLAPSAGGLAPVDLYLIANSVEGVQQGLYYYHAVGHELRLVDRANMRRMLSRAAIYAEWLAYCSVVMILVGNFDRVDWKYGERGFRFIHVDAGALCQNLYLTGTAEGLHTCAVAAYYDKDICALLGIDGDKQFPIVLFGLSTRPGSSAAPKRGDADGRTGAFVDGSP